MENKRPARLERAAEKIRDRAEIEALNQRLAALESVVRDLKNRVILADPTREMFIHYDPKSKACKVRFDESGHEVVIARDLPEAKCPYGKWFSGVDGNAIQFICLPENYYCLHLLDEDNKCEDCEKFRELSAAEASDPEKSNSQPE